MHYFYNHKKTTFLKIIFKILLKFVMAWMVSILFFFFFFFFLFRAAPAACGSSQARGQMGTAAASLHHSHSNIGSKPCLQPTLQLIAMLGP